MVDDREKQRQYDAEEEEAYWEAIERDRREEQERLDTEKDGAVDTMTTWFFQHFEYPEIQTPNDGEPESYLYPWGGPHDAGAVLHEVFRYEYDQDWISEAVAAVEKEGITEWAPTPNGDYFEPPEPEDLPGFTGEAALIARQILSRLGALEGVVAELKPRPAAIGHNAPPEDIGLPPYTDEDQNLLIKAIGEANQELRSESPDPAKIDGLAARFLRIGKVVGLYFAKKADVAVDEGIKRSVQVASWAVALGLLTEISDALTRLAKMLLGLLQ